MQDPFASSTALVAHARRRIAEFTALFTDFESSDPYELVREGRPDRYATLYVIQFRHKPPDELKIISWEIFNSLRTSLDHAMFVCAFANSKQPHLNHPSLRHVHFPFGKSKDEAKVGKSKMIPRDIFDLAISFKPYANPDGDRVLYSLNEVRNVGVHRMFVPMAIFPSGYELHSEWTPRNIGRIVRVPEQFDGLGHWDIDTQRLILGVFDEEYTVSCKLTEKPQLIFAYIKGLAGPNAIEKLNVLANRIEEVTAAIRSKAYEIGLFQ
ncbi:hypothetical protein [Terrarubrum flagellatum]|uniref:hypothetical protein n=1 Tax=Terrirubrum flagellatum TaxID=2895980 RepID=UPI003144E773